MTDFENIGPDFDTLVAQHHARYAKSHPFKAFWHRMRRRHSH